LEIAIATMIFLLGYLGLRAHNAHIVRLQRLIANAMPLALKRAAEVT
jgi:hypothetical protein